MWPWFPLVFWTGVMFPWCVTHSGDDDNVWTGGVPAQKDCDRCKESCQLSHQLYSRMSHSLLHIIYWSRHQLKTTGLRSQNQNKILLILRIDYVFVVTMRKKVMFWAVRLGNDCGHVFVCMIIFITEKWNMCQRASFKWPCSFSSSWHSKQYSQKSQENIL